MEIADISDSFNQIAGKFDEQRRYFIPCFDDYYKTSTSFLFKIRNDFKSILDLGAGTGLLTTYLFDHYPDAHFTLIDVSDKMLDVARQRFSLMQNFEYIISDYSNTLPDNKYDLIASALSIHHLPEQKKKDLYSEIYKKLNDHGFFFELDQFNAASKTINEYYNQWWYDHITGSGISAGERDSWQKRRLLDRENTIAETIDLLHKAGFGIVECIYSYMKFGVILAIR